MSWISEEHKKLYSLAANAFYQDMKTTSVNVFSETTSLLTKGYQKVRSYYQEDSNSDNDDDQINNNGNDLESDNDSDSDGNHDGNYPNVLITLDKNKHYIRKIYIIKNGQKEIVSGKISSHKFINDIIHKWFRYELENNSKWYPTEELYTSYRESSKVLNPIDNILFKYRKGIYYPRKYTE